ncbi:MAG: hypothetical protein AAGJ10_06175 [Bacteroidota bacterium]
MRILLLILVALSLASCSLLTAEDCSDFVVRPADVLPDTIKLNLSSAPQPVNPVPFFALGPKSNPSYDASSQERDVLYLAGRDDDTLYFQTLAADTAEVIIVADETGCRGAGAGVTLTFVVEPRTTFEY